MGKGENAGLFPNSKILGSEKPLEIIVAKGRIFATSELYFHHYIFTNSLLQADKIFSVYSKI